MANENWSEEAERISERIEELNVDLGIAYAQRREVLQRPEQYSLDTGKTRQFVISQRLEALAKTIASIKADIAEHESRLDALLGHGGIASVGVIAGFR